jgi:hypothetical protein
VCSVHLAHNLCYNEVVLFILDTSLLDWGYFGSPFLLSVSFIPVVDSVAVRT